jgi:hypothetical protein
MRTDAWMLRPLLADCRLCAHTSCSAYWLLLAMFCLTRKTPGTSPRPRSGAGAAPTESCRSKDENNANPESLHQAVWKNRSRKQSKRTNKPVECDTRTPKCSTQEHQSKEKCQTTSSNTHLVPCGIGRRALVPVFSEQERKRKAKLRRKSEPQQGTPHQDIPRRSTSPAAGHAPIVFVNGKTMTGPSYVSHSRDSWSRLVQAWRTRLKPTRS